MQEKVQVEVLQPGSHGEACKVRVSGGAVHGGRRVSDDEGYGTKLHVLEGAVQMSPDPGGGSIFPPLSTWKGSSPKSDRMTANEVSWLGNTVDYYYIIYICYTE